MMKGLLNKRINKIKLTLTRRCNLSCPYCFVNKKDEDMEWWVAKRFINILIQSQGKSKLLSLYGGEPLLNFNLIKKICPYAVDQARKYNKKLVISICTNLTLLQKSHLDFLNKYNVKIIFSSLGEKKWQDSVRIFKNGTGTYDLVLKNLSILFKNFKQENIGISFCVLPKTTTVMVKNFLHLLKLGIRYFNFEIIREYKPWQKSDIIIFALNYQKIIRYMLSNINKNNYLFINPINWEIAYQFLSKSIKTQCPFNYKLESYPDGSMAFSPFLLNKENKERYIIGNLKENKQYMFKFCSFSNKNKLCQNCTNKYFNSYKSDKEASYVYDIYHTLSLKAAEYILKKSKYNEHYKNYVSKIKKEVCF